jgi:hypothetical protein
MGFFDINYDALIPQLTPVKLRKPVMTAWLKVLVSPVKWLYDQFKTSRKGNLYTLAHNGQVCYLEAVLNDAFDPIVRGVYVTDGPFRDPLFLYLDAEVKPLWVGLTSEIGITPYPDPEILYTDGETYALGICFIIHVPISVAGGPGYDVTRLRALTDKFRLPGRTNYTVVTY